jgi:hypothetical protein
MRILHKSVTHNLLNGDGIGNGSSDDDGGGGMIHIQLSN